jgi:hypothetical protein
VVTLSTLVATALPAGGLAGQLITPGGAHLRNSTYVGVGFVANVINSVPGVSALALTPEILGGAGVYADVKFSTSSPENDPYLLTGVTPDEAELTFGDLHYDEKGVFLSVDLALVYAVLPELGIYAGAGYTREERYIEYQDDSQTRGEFGFYWVADTAESGDRVNLLGGALFRFASRLLFQVGMESQPLGVTLGAVIAFPL